MRYRHTTTFRQITRCDVEGGGVGGGGVVKLLRGKIAKNILLGGKSARRRRKILRIWNIIRWRTLLLGAFQNCSKLLSIEKISLWEQGDWNFRSSVAILPCKISILDFKFSKKNHLRWVSILSIYKGG